MPDDDGTVADSDVLYRRIPPSQAPFDANRNRRFPSSAALLPSSGDTEVSVYSGAKLTEIGLVPLDVLEAHEQHGLFCFTALAAREAGYGIKSDPVIDSERPLKVDSAHVVLTGTPAGSKQKRNWPVRCWGVPR